MHFLTRQVKAGTSEELLSLDHGGERLTKEYACMVDQEETSEMMEASALMSTVHQTLTTDTLSGGTATMAPTKAGLL